MSFSTTSPSLARALAERNYDQPTPVQAAVLADDAAGHDLLVSAQTGSGKTVAYGLAMASNLLGDAERFEAAGAPRALIVAPTRELAMQVQRELSWLYQHAGGRIVACVGGMDPRREQRELAAGAHIVVGTPGRLCDHLRRGRLDTSELAALVLDEADEMLNLGFREDLEFILQATPETRRTLLFSATFPRGIVALARQYQRDAFRIEVAGDEGGHADIEYRALRIAPGDVEHGVVNVLRYFESPSALVFCNTREAVRHLQAALLERGFSVVALSGELTQNERTRALQALRDGRSRVCVATDVAARGIDLPSLDLVIHADLPNDPEVMQHRSGRTGRAGRKGVSVLLVPPARRRRAELLLDLSGVEAIWGAAPQADEIRRRDQERMLQDAMFTDETTPDDLALAQALLAERSAEDIATALARLYRARLPAPEDVLDPGEGRGKDRGKERTRDRDRPRDDRPPRGDDREDRPRPKAGKARHGMTEATVWFRAAIGWRKNAEARWLLPMICRRGGIDRQDIGAIRIHDTTTEFEISERVAEDFAAKVRRPDKEDSIRIEPLAGAPAVAPAHPVVDDVVPWAGQSDAPRHAPEDRGDGERRHDGERDAARPKHRGKSFGDKSFGDKRHSDKPHGDKPYRDKPRGDTFRDDKPQRAKFRDDTFRDDKFRDDRSGGDRSRGDKPLRKSWSPVDEAPRGKPYRDKPRRDGNAAFSDRPAFGKKKHDDGNAAFAEKPAFKKKHRDGDAVVSDKPSFGKKKPSFGKKPHRDKSAPAKGGHGKKPKQRTRR
ncbi:DEAD/DEAH box helicase [Bradyrhizobium sp. U87765 SZCCT0131]|uniref:DEAD/DEAH box helicase n=1 Tax=unclassified Bradyrhizobium TaxID=2631580 RepID=UPI001BADAC38|nr:MULTISPECIES: DEAD/DEAH box helicase [unclassified Bradyrhizobium]MBR1219275.1 DEAD/DEAH box helicase [Bradyrhizobium sp. U87765 SZCCT0131]MBR1261926.1 DEAD/DEAH box helicase [Bradyrhizobium sp. U87765 SZCCT0134]MBR1306221.1 DEAD/DEAH box helicase [Bradyrhizobium sp. U87765 SZCCT0110]MBR1317708.1 DEAD/DEAH box helicase [Bradyrhizobium sp. U87765 SZCCT0109]MBR1351410.1 DEAD/DEAH box helicase [Bradyrhizobium sp. U87765 SZCCT0048]